MYSDTSSHVPIDLRRLWINCVSSSVALTPRTKTEAAAPTIAGVFGMTRITLESFGKICSISFNVIPIAIDTKSFPEQRLFTSSSAVFTTFGFTETKTMSDFITTDRFSVTASAPNSLNAINDATSDGWTLAIKLSLFVSPNQWNVRSEKSHLPSS